MYVSPLRSAGSIQGANQGNFHQEDRIELKAGNGGGIFEKNVLLATVRTLLIRLMTLAFMLAVSCTPPKPGSDNVVKPTNDASRIALAFLLLGLDDLEAMLSAHYAEHLLVFSFS